MAKLTRYSSFEELESDIQPNTRTEAERDRVYAELEEFIKLLRESIVARKKAEAIARESVREMEIDVDYTINPELDGKYDNDPYFQEKLARANEIIERCGVPKFPERSKKR